MDGSFRDKEEHARTWNKAIGKVIEKLDKNDMETAMSIFMYRYEHILNAVPSERERENIFLSWLISSFNKENIPLIKWYIHKYGKDITENEKKVLVAGLENYENFFLIDENNNNILRLIDIDGKKFTVETIDMQPLNKEDTIFARIFSKGNGLYFLNGSALVYSGNEVYIKAKKHEDFLNSWSKYLVGFFKHQVSKGLSKKTADDNMENANVLMFFLETKPNVTSFGEVKKSMLKTEFKNYVRRHILPKVDIDKLYYSLNKFYKYLIEKKEIEKCEASEWLEKRCS